MGSRGAGDLTAGALRFLGSRALDAIMTSAAASHPPSLAIMALIAGKVNVARLAGERDASSNLSASVGTSSSSIGGAGSAKGTARVCQNRISK